MIYLDYQLPNDNDKINVNKFSINNFDKNIIIQLNIIFLGEDNKARRSSDGLNELLLTGQRKEKHYWIQQTYSQLDK